MSGLAHRLWRDAVDSAPVQFALGMLTTLKHVWQKPTTIQYPEEKPVLGARFRGLHYLARYENGLERCVGCSLCAAACPARCITVVPGENTDEERYSPTERYAKVYVIDELRCIFCGLCVAACPEDAIRMTRKYEIAQYSREDFIYDKRRLLEPEPGYYERSQWGVERE